MTKVKVTYPSYTPTGVAVQFGDLLIWRDVDYWVAVYWMVRRGRRTLINTVARNTWLVLHPPEAGAYIRHGDGRVTFVDYTDAKSMIQQVVNIIGS